MKAKNSTQCLVSNNTSLQPKCHFKWFSYDRWVVPVCAIGVLLILIGICVFCYKSQRKSSIKPQTEKNNSDTTNLVDVKIKGKSFRQGNKKAVQSNFTESQQLDMTSNIEFAITNTIIEAVL